MGESTAVTNIISRSSKVSEIWDSVDPSVLCKIKNKINLAERFFVLFAFHGHSRSQYLLGLSLFSPKFTEIVVAVAIRKLLSVL